MQMLLAVLNRLTGAILAVAVSFTLWLVIMNEQNQRVLTEVEGAIDIEARNLPADLVLGSELQPVRVRVYTLQDHVPRLRKENFRVSVDLTDGARGVREYSIRAESSDARATIYDVVPSAMTIRLDQIVRKEVPVRVRTRGRAPDGFLADESQARVSPERVTVIGPQTVVDSIEEVLAIVSLDGAREPIRQSVRPAPQAPVGADPRGLTTNPSSVLVDLPVRPELRVKVVPVLPTLSGTIRAGYRLVSADVNPPAVAVVGDPDTIDRLSSVATAGIDVRNASTDIIRPAPIVLDTGVRLLREEQVTVHVSLRAVEGAQTVRVAPTAINLAEGLEATFSRAAVAVRLAGPEPTLDALPLEDVKVTVDLAERGPGDYRLTPVATAPPPIRIVSIEPAEVEVQIR